MMHQQKRRRLTGFERCRDTVYRSLGSINGGDDTSNGPAVLHLQSIDRSRVIRYLANLEILVEVVHHLTQWNAWMHHYSSIERGRGAATRVPAIMESRAASMRLLRLSGTRLSRRGFGTYSTMPPSSPKTRVRGVNLPERT